MVFALLLVLWVALRTFEVNGANLLLIPALMVQVGILILNAQSRGQI